MNKPPVIFQIKDGELYADHIKIPGHLIMRYNFVVNKRWLKLELLPNIGLAGLEQFCQKILPFIEGGIMEIVGIFDCSETRWLAWVSKNSQAPCNITYAHYASYTTT